MPGLDQTGPMGMGPMTGGARGECNPHGSFKNAAGTGPNLDRNRGRGRCRRNHFRSTVRPGRERRRFESGL
jgi:hypothetical protein